MGYNGNNRGVTHNWDGGISKGAYRSGRSAFNGAISGAEGLFVGLCCLTMSIWEFIDGIIPRTFASGIVCTIILNILGLSVAFLGLYDFLFDGDWLFSYVMLMCASLLIVYWNISIAAGIIEEDSSTIDRVKILLAIDYAFWFIIGLGLVVPFLARYTDALAYVADCERISSFTMWVSWIVTIGYLGVSAYLVIRSPFRRRVAEGLRESCE